MDLDSEKIMGQSIDNSRKMTIERIREVDQDWWNAKVLESHNSTIFHTTFWANFLSEYTCAEPVYLLARDSTGEIIGLLLMFKQALYFEHFFERPIGRIIIPLLRRCIPSFYWQQGPLFFKKEEKEGIGDAFLDEVGAQARKEKVFKVSFSRRIDDEDDALDEKIIRRGFKCRLRETIIVDLRESTESLWKNMKASARKSVKRAEKDGIAVGRIQSIEELEQYYQLCKTARAGLGLKTFSIQNFLTMWKYLKDPGCVDIFLARKEGEILAGLGVWHLGRDMVEFASAQTARAFDQKLYGNDAIKWKIIQWGRENGYHYYDLAGVDSSASEGTKERNIYQFKSKWGGRLVQVREYSKRGR